VTGADADSGIVQIKYLVLSGWIEEDPTRAIAVDRRRVETQDATRALRANRVMRAHVADQCALPDWR